MLIFLVGDFLLGDAILYDIDGVDGADDKVILDTIQLGDGTGVFFCTFDE